MTNHTPTPWKTCGCGCGMINGANHPIAKVESGKWGDTYPAIRPIGASFERKYEAYIEKIAYGEIHKEEAEANAAFIVRACNAHEDLIKAVEDTNRLIRKCQDVLSLYLQPKGNMRDAIMALLGLLDGPEQREIQGRVISALAKAKGE